MLIGKERLEAFSDGVFAILLTLLVFSLNASPTPGIGGLHAAAPALFVHAGAFFVIGMAWVTHHQFFEHVVTIGRRTLAFNLIALFWITLIPFGARVAEERPNDGLGAAIMACGVTLSLVSVLVMSAASRFSSPVLDPEMTAIRRNRQRYFILYAFTGAISAGMSIKCAMFGYTFLASTGVALLVRPLSEVSVGTTFSQP